MRLIDADKLWKDTTSTIEECAEFLEVIEKQPTVDAVPVVRCKECKWGDTWVCSESKSNTWYCPKGKRKEE